MQARNPEGIAHALSVGEVAQRSGVAVSTLHFYEAKGLIGSERTESNHRRYPRAVLRRVAFIRVAQRVGIPLADIATALEALPTGDAPSRAGWARLAANWGGELVERMAQHKLGGEGAGPRRLLPGAAGVRGAKD